MATNRELLLKSSLSSMLKGILTTLLHIFLYFILFLFLFIYLFFLFLFWALFSLSSFEIIFYKNYSFNNAWKKSVFWVFLVRIFQQSDWIRRDTPYLFVFSPNAGKYGPEKLQIPPLFTQCKVVNLGTSSRFLLHFVQ